MKAAIILRGISGCGKSHFANAIRQAANELGMSHAILSTDDFFMDAGEYRFEISKLSEAHTDCLCRFVEACHSDTQVVVVDNTNIRTWELMPYYKVAAALGYSIRIISLMPGTLGDLRAVYERSQHRVPATIVGAAALEYEPFIEELHIKSYKSALSWDKAAALILKALDRRS